MDTKTDPALAVLRRQYLQLVDPPELRWPKPSLLKQATVQSWIFHHLFDIDNISTLPPQRYQLMILKLLISKLESSFDDPEEDELSDDLMSALSSLLGTSMPSELASAQQKAYVTYAFPLHSTDASDPQDCSITLLESRAVISSSGTTGLRTWEAALFLGAFLVSEGGQGMIRGKNIVEIGAGTGMLSLLCAKHLGVAGMVATDGDEAVVDAIKTNVFLNGLDMDEPTQSTVRNAALKWGRPIDATSFTEDYGMEVPDVLLGADVTYDKVAIPALVSTLRDFFDLNPALQVLIAATVRNEQTFEAFLNACRRNRFNLVLVEFPTLPEHLQCGPFYPTSVPINIWRITRAQAAEDQFAF